ncbi:MAG TPA: hypothetical protein ENN72_03430 [Firmicutes bacterium]|nr:hypothetical protein [Bacillota bacterium]
MKQCSSLSNKTRKPLEAPCPLCGTVNSFVPSREPYLFCRHCHYVYAWVNKEGIIIFEKEV